MKLYDYMKLTEADYDTYDTVYDNGVTVCFIDEEDEKRIVIINSVSAL